MNRILTTVFNKKKLKGLLFEATIGNFIGFLAGSLVFTFSTYRIYEQKGIKNLFGILPRKKIVVHFMPE